MAGRSYLAKAGKRVPLVENDSLFYLPVVYGPGMGGQHVHNMVGIERSLPCVPVHALRMPAWHLVEWCCERDSQLADWFTSHAQSAERLHLPEHDMRTRACARQVVRNVIQVTARGTNVLLWAAIPCGPWRSWQRVNMCSGASTAERIRLQRLESQRMLAVRCETVEQLLRLPRKAGCGEIHAAFEWPCGAYEQAATLPEMKRLRCLLPHECRFDGCMYAL